MKLPYCVAIVLTVLACSCGGPASRLPPAPATGPSPAPSGVTHGVVYEIDQGNLRRPVPNLRLLVWQQVTGRVDAVRLPDVTTDVSGRFGVSGATGPLVYIETAAGSPVKTLCASGTPVLLRPERVEEVFVVDASWSGDWQPSRPPLLSGVVSERVGGVVRPVAGATVTLDDGRVDPPATTNAIGFYSICSAMGADFTVTVTARKDRYRSATKTMTWGWDYVVNFTLDRSAD
jgi:hypothetical protein